MRTDVELLRCYAKENDEQAFAELVRRNIGLVYAAALRQLAGAGHRAEEVTQSVFVDLARRASELARRDDIAGWLYTSTHYAAAKLKRGEARRQTREQEAQRMHGFTGSENSVEWERVRPVLDEAMLALPERDREAVLLRFFRGLRVTEVGRLLGITDDAARMRIERALDKLQGALASRGVTSSAMALAVALEAGATTAVPAGLAGSVVAAGVATAATAGGGVTAGGVVFAIAAIAATAGWVGVVALSQNVTAMAREVEALRMEARVGEKLEEQNRALRARERDVEALRSTTSEQARLAAEAVALRRQLASRRRDSAPATASSGTEYVTMTLPGVDVTTMLSAYEIHAGKKVMRDKAIERSSALMHLTTGLVTREEALELLRNELRERANIVIETAPDGSLSAKKTIAHP